MSNLKTKGEDLALVTYLLDDLEPKGPQQFRLAKHILGSAPVLTGDVHPATHGRVGHTDFSVAAMCDLLARRHALLPEEWLLLLEPIDAVAIREPGAVCEHCQTAPAFYETWTSAFGLAIFLCQACASPFHNDALGAGTFTALIDEREVPDDLANLCNDVCRELSRPPIFDHPTSKKDNGR